MYALDSSGAFNGSCPLSALERAVVNDRMARSGNRNDGIVGAMVVNDENGGKVCDVKKAL